MGFAKELDARQKLEKQLAKEVSRRRGRGGGGGGSVKEAIPHTLEAPQALQGGHVSFEGTSFCVSPPPRTRLDAILCKYIFIYIYIYVCVQYKHTHTHIYLHTMVCFELCQEFHKQQLELQSKASDGIPGFTTWFRPRIKT